MTVYLCQELQTGTQYTDPTAGNSERLGGRPACRAGLEPGTPTSVPENRDRVGAVVLLSSSDKKGVFSGHFLVG